MLVKLFTIKNCKSYIYYINFYNNESFDYENDLIKIKNILSCNYRYEITDIHLLHLDFEKYIEIGPHNNFKTAWCSNVLSILRRCNINSVSSIEFTTLYEKDNFNINYDKMLYKVYQNNEINNIEYDKNIKVEKCYNISKNEALKFSDEFGLGFRIEDIDLLYSVKTYFTNVELFDLSQCNSEHARHHFFNGIIDGDKTSLLMKIKNTYKKNKHKNVVVAFKDNASIIEGQYCVDILLNNSTNQLVPVNDKFNFSYKAETHNFPTGICPFPGAETGVGGRIRDTLSCGRGGDIIAGTAGYCVGDILHELYAVNQYNDYYNNLIHNKPLTILIEASNGASDYGNKIGEPIIQGFCRSYRGDFINNNNINNNNKNNRIEYLKPIMFSGGIGKILNKNNYKKKLNYGDLLIRIGGPAYRIGLGGGTASSREQDDKNSKDDFNAVQRGDPEMASKLVRFIRKINYYNYIKSIHDQGSGGMANVSREIAEPYGAKIFLDNIYCGDKTLNSLEKWVAEYQEQISFIIDFQNYLEVKKIAKKENLSLVIAGFINNSKKIEVISSLDDIKPVDLQFFLVNNKKYTTEKPNNQLTYIDSNININNSNDNKLNLLDYLSVILRDISVGSKQFLTNKVDRSVSGLIIQQQCVGPFQLPLSNYSLVLAGYSSSTGLVSSIGEQPLKGIKNDESIGKMVRMSLGEMLTNMISVPISSLESINMVANWMWSSIDKNDSYLLKKGVETLTESVEKLGMCLTGGKDSLSMKVKNNELEVKSPNTVVISGYTTVNTFENRLNCVLKNVNSVLLLVKFNDLNRLGGSIFEKYYPNIENLNYETPDFIEFDKFKEFNSILSKYIILHEIYSCHDISDGGVITSLIEMSISSGIGIVIKELTKNLDFLFCEELGLVLEINPKILNEITSKFKKINLDYLILGSTVDNQKISINIKDYCLEENIDNIRELWQETSYRIEEKQCKLECIREERNNLKYPNIVKFNIPESIGSLFKDVLSNKNKSKSRKGKDKINLGIVREEGSNGDREMTYCFNEAGFSCYEITVDDIINDVINLEDFRGLAFVGGFSFSDVLGSAVGWYSSIIHNPKVKKQFDNFYQRKDTFSLGVCNGCQLLSLLGCFPGNVKLERNISDRFESRYNFVKVLPNNNSIFLKDMDDLFFGIWSNHTEGRIVSNNNDDLIYPIKYCDDLGNVTEKYPFNPNGSNEGRCCISSNDGRHLGIMPHPERLVLKKQLPYVDIGTIENKTYKKLGIYSPWMKIFLNAYQWCLDN